MNPDDLEPHQRALFDEATYFARRAVNTVPDDIARQHFFIARLLWPPKVWMIDEDEDGYGTII